MDFKEINKHVFHFLIIHSSNVVHKYGQKGRSDNKKLSFKAHEIPLFLNKWNVLIDLPKLSAFKTLRFTKERKSLHQDLFCAKKGIEICVLLRYSHIEAFSLIKMKIT